MICKRCFRMSDDGFKFCPYCGKSVSDDSEIEVNEADTNTPDEQGTGNVPVVDPLHRPDNVPQGGQPYRGYTMPPPMMPQYQQYPQYPFYAPMPREKTPTEKFFSGLGHAALYALLFIACQIIVSFVYIGAVSGSVEAAFIAETGYSEFDILKDPAVATQYTDYLMMTMQKDGGYSIVGILSAAITVAAVFIIAKVKSRSFSEHTGFYPIHTWKVLLLLPAGVAVNYLTLLIIGLIPWPEWAINELNSTYSYIAEGPTVFIYALNLIASVIAAPVVEELIFRGCVFTRLRRGMPTAVAAMLSAFCFGLMHGIVIAIFYATILGLMLAYTYNKFESVLAPMVLHIGFNLTNYLPFMPEEAEGSETQVIIVFVASAVVFTLCSAVILCSDVSRKKKPAENDTNFPDHPNFPNV